MLCCVAAFWTTCVASFGIYFIYYYNDEFGRMGRLTDLAAYGTAILFISSSAVNIKVGRIHQREAYMCI